MRMPLPLVLLAVLPSVSLTAQVAPKTSPWSFAAGPAFDVWVTGIAARAEYSLLRDRWFGLRLDMGLFWTPDQNISRSYFMGRAQASNVSVGLLAVVSPLPRSRFSPYGVVGVAAVQGWNSSRGSYIDRDGTVGAYNAGSSSFGEFGAIVGLGVRLRVGERPFKVEVRTQGPGIIAATIGTSFARPK